jgi:hypothetical protein
VGCSKQSPVARRFSWERTADVDRLRYLAQPLLSGEEITLSHHARYAHDLTPNDFEPPFDGIVEDVVQKGYVLHESLSDYMRPQWKQRSLEILIVDDPSLNACVTYDDGRDQVSIFRGAFEHIYGTILGLLSTPAFFPAIGNAEAEMPFPNLPREGFARVPVLRDASNRDPDTPVRFPNDQTRMTVAQILADLALEFLVYHEIGHIVGGHLEILQGNQRLASISEFEQAIDNPADYAFRHVLECDADAFACHVTSGVHTNDKMAALVRDLVNASKWHSKDFALLTYLMAIGILFRVLHPHATANISESKSSHPHPAVRACLVASSTVARAVFAGAITWSRVNDIMKDSVRNIEDVWAGLFLPGHNPEPPELWAQHVGSTAMGLFRSYGNARALLDRYARLPRRWDDWKWPETSSSV